MLSKDELEEFGRRIEAVQERRKNRKIFCYQCKGDTKQETLFEKVEMIPPKELIFYDEDGTRKESVWTIEAQVWHVTECLGCERTNLNVYSRHSPAEDDLQIHHFPTKDFRTFPMWATHLNRKYVELFGEIYISLNSGNIRLPLMGARTLLDMFIVEKIGDVGTFKQKLEKLVSEKHISEASKKLLGIALEFGNATIHRGYVPTKEDLNSVLDIIENVLHSEVLSGKSEALKDTAPKR
ncbi:DUF4145 domain-containing protein [Fluviicola sp. SGL-29]|nr:DUF4145 domain-containing protein [Fluviicola sp. SGL-29]